LSLQIHVEGGRLHQSVSQVDGQDDVHHVDLLDHYSVRVELYLQLSHHRSRQLRLDVSHAGNLDLFKEVSDFLVALFGEKLFESVGPEVVEESFDIFLVGSLATIWVSRFAAPNVEVNTNVN